MNSPKESVEPSKSPKKLSKKKLLLLGIPLVILILIICAIAVFFIDRESESFTLIPGNESTGDLTPVPAPVVTDKIKGYWSSRGVGGALEDLNDAERMKEDGINTITFSPQLTHTQEGEVNEGEDKAFFSDTESQTRKAINKAHEAGFRVLLETTPMNAGAVDPKVTNVKLFQDDMTELAIKYARIAEEYDVEYFAPIVEPAHHMSVPEADEWLQELLPKLKAVYSGPIMWKKQSMHLNEVKEWEQDHIMTLGFKLESNGLQINFKSTKDHQISFSFHSDRMSLTQYEGDSKKFDITKQHNTNLQEYHTIRFEIEGQQIRIFLDGALMIEYTDDSGPMGGYVLGSDKMRINKFEVTDMQGSKLLVEDFETLNNWSAVDEWKIEGKEIAVSLNKSIKLLHDIDFSGYDYLAIDTFKRGQVQTNEEYIEFLEYVVYKTNQQAESDGVPNVIIAEFGGSIMEEIGWIDVDERAKIPMTETELAEVTRMVLELAEDTVDGYMYNGWDIEGQGLKRMPEVEAVIKDWYTSH